LLRNVGGGLPLALLPDAPLLAIGEGILDFDNLFSWLYVQGKTPILILEPHEEKAVIPALEGLAGLLSIYPIIPHV